MRGATHGSFWYTARHAELVRPMLTLCSQPLVDSLAFGLASAGDAGPAEPVLASLVTVVQLAGVLGLDELCEKAVGVLAHACGVYGPAAYQSPAEAKQLAVLKVRSVCVIFSC